MKKNGIIKECLVCTKNFYVALWESDRKYCSSQCYWITKLGTPIKKREGTTLACTNCEKPFYVPKYQIDNSRHFCSYKCYWKFRSKYYRLSKHPMWKGGRSLTVNGYVTIIEEEGKNYEHRIVVETIIGRKLKRNEYVHHIDHDTSNNSPDNLIVLSASDHTKLHHKGLI